MDISTSIPSCNRIAILLVDGFALMSLASFAEPLRAANQLTGNDHFRIIFLSTNTEYATSSLGVKVPCTHFTENKVTFDSLFVIAGGNPAIYQNHKMFRWLRKLDYQGKMIGGISGGPVILVKAGIMNGYRMTVHWEHAEVVEELAPGLLLERSLYVTDRNRITCAGGIAPLDLAHTLIEKQIGLDLARRVSDWFMHTNVRRPEGAQRAGLVERYKVRNRLVIDAISAMENHIADPLTLEMLALLSNVSSRQLNRLFRKELGVSTMTFYRQIRLSIARQMLTGSTLSINQIAIATGFSNASHFTKSFKIRYYISPSQIYLHRG